LWDTDRRNCHRWLPSRGPGNQQDD
jgi:hypothetical protein